MKKMLSNTLRITRFNIPLLPPLPRAEEVIKLISDEIDKVNNQIARVENIRKFRLLDKKLYTEDGEVTPTMKVKRKSISAQYKDIIEDMYKDME